MARNSSGVYILPIGSTAVSHALISSQAYNTFLNDIATAMTDSLNVQGTAPMQAALNMGGFKAVNVGDPTSAQDAVTKNYFSLNAVNVQGTATMAAALNLGGFKIINVADPTLAQDAVTKNYFSLNAVNVQGTNAMQAALSLGGFKITNVADPVSAQDAVTKNYFSVNAVNVQGTAVMLGALNLGGFKITNVADPVSAQDATTLHYLTTNYVPITGGFYSGSIGVSATAPLFTLSKATGANANIINGSTAGTARWTVTLGNSSSETGLNAGSNFDITAYSDAGTLLSIPLSINRGTGAASFNNNANFNGVLNANANANLTGGGTLSGGFAASGSFTFANGLTVNGSAATLNAGLTVTTVTASGLATLNSGVTVTGAASFGSTPTHPTPAAADNSTKSATTAFLYSNIGSAISQLAFGAVGTLCTAAGPNGLAPGTTTAGSGLTTFNSNSATSQTLTGTWMYLGNSSFSANGQLYIRIS